MDNLQYNSWLNELQPFPITKCEEIKQKLFEKGISIYDFTIGDPKELTPDFIIASLVKNIAKCSQYPPNKGEPFLLESCAQWLHRRFAIELNADAHLISSNGSKEAIFHVPQILLNSASARRMIIIPEPGYPVYKSSCILAGGIAYENLLQNSYKYIFNPADIPKALLPHIAAIWLCYPHNPTGATINFASMEHIYSWALENNIVILSDECYCDIFYPDTNSPSSFLQVAQQNKFKNVLSFFSLSKRSGMTGYRSGFVAGDAQLIAAFTKLRLNIGLGTPTFIQHAAATAWADNQHVAQRNKIFAEKRKVAALFFQRNNFNILESNATFYIWGEIPSRYASDRDFAAQLLLHTGIMVTPGSAFGPSCSRNFRLALVPTVDDMVSCFKNWQQKIDEGIFKI